jgi:hypothetical protein
MRLTGASAFPRFLEDLMTSIGRAFLVASVLSATAVSGAAAAENAGEQITINFEEFAQGEIITSVAHPGSDLSIHVYGVNPGFKRNAAVVFDSSDPGPEDPDLGSPNEEFEIVGPDGSMVPGPGRGEGGKSSSLCRNETALGKILIVDDDLSPLTEAGLVQEPNDEGRIGARLLFDFSDIGPVTIHGLAVIDVEEPDAEIWFYNVAIDQDDPRPSRKHQLAEYRVHTEDNGVARLFDPELREQDEGCHVTLMRRKAGQPLEPVPGVMAVEVAFSGSGAIARLVYSVPTAKGAMSSG